jgi:hypothetical protein
VTLDVVNLRVELGVDVKISVVETKLVLVVLWMINS